MREIYYSDDKPLEIYHLIFRGGPTTAGGEEKGHYSHRLKLEGEIE